MKDKWPSGMGEKNREEYLENISGYIIGACDLIVKEYANDPDKMFNSGFLYSTRDILYSQNLTRDWT